MPQQRRDKVKAPEQGLHTIPLDQEDAFGGAVTSCGEPQQNRIRPKSNADIICTICGVDDEQVAAEVEYEGRFLDGGGSGSIQATKAVVTEVDQHMEDSSGDVAKAKTMKTPVGPSSIERDNHNATHLPYRSWCISWVVA